MQRLLLAILAAVLFTALSVGDAQAVCGDGILDGGEQCDDGTANGGIGSCCSLTCECNVGSTGCGQVCAGGLLTCSLAGGTCHCKLCGGLPDDDADGVGNECDNCQTEDNPDQRDSDGDCSTAAWQDCGDVCDPCPTRTDSCIIEESTGESIDATGGTVETPGLAACPSGPCPPRVSVDVPADALPAARRGCAGRSCR